MELMDRSGKLSALWECGYYAIIFGHTYEDIIRMDDEVIDSLFELFQHNRKMNGLYSASPEWEIGYNAWAITQAAKEWRVENDRLIDKAGSLVDKFLRSR